MPRSLRAYLWDIEEAANDTLNFTRGKELCTSMKATQCCVLQWRGISK